MKNFYTIALFFLASFASAQDFSRPGAGANEWSYDQNIVNIPTQGVNTQRLDRYWRFTWLDFQPGNGSAGVYNFSIFDSKIQQSISKGQTFSFGVMQQCGGCDANLQTNISGSVMLYPTWLHTQMQGESVKDFTSGGEWFPNYNSPSYLMALKNLNVAINNHILSGSYNGVRYQDVIGQIDIRGYGDFGEWTNNVFNVGNITVPTGDSIISYHVHVFDKFQCVYMMATVDGGQLSNTNVPPAVGYYALTVSNSVGKLGWRRDSWGQTDNYLSQWTDANPTVYNGLVFKTEIMNRYQFAPIVGEPQDGGSAGTFNSLPAQMTKYGTTSFGNGNFNVASNATNATVANNFRAASAVAGYKFSISSGSLSGNQFALTWTNQNTAPAYWPWSVTYELRNGATVIWTAKSTVNLKTLLHGSVTVIDPLPNGTGDLYLVIRDPLKFRKPMPLAITGQQSDGSYLLKSGINITGGSTPPPVDTTVIPIPPVDTTHPINCDTTIKVKRDSVYKVSHDTTVYISKDSLIHRTCGGTVPPTNTAVSVFTNQVPTSAAERDNTTGITVGMQFTTSASGQITGVRFYKQSGNIGSHVGIIYSPTGTVLWSQPFTNETASGWQTVIFTTPLQVTAGSYVAACYSASGWYNSDNTGFKTPVTNGVLTGTKGVYLYGNGFPTSTYLQSNYWTDIIFSPTK